MRIAKGFFVGLIFSVISSFCLSFLFMLCAQNFAGGVTSLFGESWLYLASIFPFTLTFSILGMYFSKQEKITNKKLWFLSIILAFIQHPKHY